MRSKLWATEDGEKAALQFLSETTEATAIQTTSDLVAIGATTILRQRGLTIPHDLSVTGFGNIAWAEYISVPLTTVQQPTTAVGDAAVEIMLGLLRGEGHSSKRIAAELIVRSSTAPPAARAQPAHS